MANILIADDDPILMDLYRLKFTKKNHVVRPAPNREALFKELKGQKPDIILLDRRLGESDGLELLAEIRKEDQSKSVPVFMLTNMEPSAEDIATVEKLGPAKYFIKERVDLDDLNKVIEETVK
ncbi:MAG: response regulator [Candidatus Saccharibacteria bacterium]